VLTSGLSDRWIYRLGAGAAVVGSLLGMVGNLVHPATPLDDPQGIARTIAESGAMWISIHLVIVIGIALMLGGLVGLFYALRGGMAGAFALFGLVAAVAGATIGLILVILDGVASPQLAKEWMAASQDESEVALQIVLVSETLNFALASLFNFVFAGATFLLFGLAVASSRVFPRWLGWVVVVAAVGSIGAGLIQAYAGEPTTASRILTIIGPTTITLWLLVIGILLGRLLPPTETGIN
jgi:hypothetical protein